MIAVPRRRASRAGTRPAKNTQTCAPLPDRENLESRRDAEFGTGLHKGLGVFSPVGFVEIDGEKMTGVVLQQRIDADDMLAGKMVVQDRIR